MDNLKWVYRQKIVLFSLEEARHALYLCEVEKVVRAVEIIPLPKAPEIVLGVINFHGEIIPAIDIRRCFKLPLHELCLLDQFIIARTSKRLVMLVVDSVNGVYDLENHQVIDAGEALPYTDYLSGIAEIENVVVLINDLEKFISLDEHNKLDEALSGAGK